MATPFEVRGAEDFGHLARALRDAGRKQLKKELQAGVRKAATPLLRVARDGAREVFPHRGGLAFREGRVQFRVQVRTGVTTAGVRIVAPGKYLAAKSVNRTGRFRHPVFADSRKTRRQWTWVTQEVPGGQGWFDDRMLAAAPAVRPEIEAAMSRVVDQIVKGARHG